MHIVDVSWKDVNFIEDILTINRSISKGKLKTILTKGYKIYDNEEYIILALEKINKDLYKNFLVIAKSSIIKINKGE